MWDLAGLQILYKSSFKPILVHISSILACKSYFSTQVCAAADMEAMSVASLAYFVSRCLRGRRGAALPVLRQPHTRGTAALAYSETVPQHRPPQRGGRDIRGRFPVLPRSSTRGVRSGICPGSNRLEPGAPPSGVVHCDRRAKSPPLHTARHRSTPPPCSLTGTPVGGRDTRLRQKAPGQTVPALSLQCSPNTHQKTGRCLVGGGGGAARRVFPHRQP